MISQETLDEAALCCSDEDMDSMFLKEEESEAATSSKWREYCREDPWIAVLAATPNP